MNDFLSLHDVLKNTSTFNKPTYVKREQGREDMTKFIAHYLRYDLASEVVQAYRPILSHLVWIIHFREQHNARMGEVLRNHLCTEKGMYNPH